MNYQKPGLFAGNNTEYLQLMQGQQQQQQGQSQECMPNMPHSNDSSFIQAHGYPSQQPQYQYYSASNTNNNFSYPPLQSTTQAPTAAAAGQNEMSPLQPTSTDHSSMHPTSTGHNSMTPTDLMTNIGLNPQDYSNSNKPMLTEEHNRSIISPGSWSESPHNNDFLNNTIISSTGLVSLTDATTSVNTGSFRSRKASKCSENNNINNNNSQLSEAELKARKKLQNRAAQKAFRERKDNKMKQLEEKLIATETNRQELLKEIEELRKLNMEVNTENKILLQKHNDINENDNNNDSNSDKNTNSNFSFPTEDEFFETMVIDSIKNDVNDRVFKHEDGTINEQSFIRENIHFTDESGKQFFTVPATWDYLSELQEIEDFDVYFVMQSLKGKQVCDEHGPSYPKSLIDKFVQEASLQ